MARFFDVYAPLHDFDWPGGDFTFAQGVVIKRLSSPPDLTGLEKHASGPEWDRALDWPHWLTFQWADSSVPLASEVINLVLLSLWLVKPIRAQVALRFKVGRDNAAGENNFTRLLDRFVHYGGTGPTISDNDLQAASAHYAAMEPLVKARGRLNNAFVLTLSGCWASGWQTALICYAAAAETLLTYSMARGLTKRLATSYACLVASDKATRDMAFSEFTDLYSARSDVTHGRTHMISAGTTLATLTKFEQVLRTLWLAVLGSPAHTAALEQDDSVRQKYLAQLEAGYAPPPKSP